MALSKPAAKPAARIALDVVRRTLRADGGDVLDGFKVPSSLFKKGPMGASMAPVTGLAPKAKKAPSMNKMPKLNSFPRALKTQRTDKRIAGFAEGGATPSTDALVGPVISTVPGRTDKHPVNVLAGSYVLPSSHVASLGEDNTLAGMKILAEMFPNSTQPEFGGDKGSGGIVKRADGGYAVTGGPSERVPIIIAGGEFVVHPKDVMEVGEGNLERGHRGLDGWVMSRRKKHIKTLQGLSPPAKD